METACKEMIWRQLGATIDMLENAITACPDKVWGNRIDWHEFWYLTSHTLFWLDYYLSDDPDFIAPEPFDMCEVDPNGALPPRIYSKDELLTYLAHGRARVREVIAALTDEDLTRDSRTRPGLTVVEMLLYSMRHVQHHAAQLNLLLRQQIDSAPRWVGKTKEALLSGQ